MLIKLKAFIRAVSSNAIGKSGVILTNASFFTLLFIEFFHITGILTNAYIGLVTYMVLPALFIFGLLLIPFGWWRVKRKTGISFSKLLDKEFDPDLLTPQAFGSTIVRTVVILTLINIVFFGIISIRMLHFMDQAEFCGTACHVMDPEWTTYQGSPHAHVKCVSCHVGEGVGALVDAKINGLYQVISLTLGLYESPIPTPVHQLRPARETCEKCHWPDKFYGNRLKTITHFQNDSANTVLYTTLNLKVGGADKNPATGIHWHVSKNHQVLYQSADEKRNTMVWVEVKDKEGISRRFTNTKYSDDMLSEESETRVMDCVDCHNRATHIYEEMDAAINLRMAKNIIPSNLPYIKKIALSALNVDYPDKETGFNLVQNYVHESYSRDFPDISRYYSQEIDKAAYGIAEIYERNIHPEMNITWGAYPNRLGHRNDSGCFRCHNKDMIDDTGKAIRYDCTLCHSILAWDEPKPFAYIEEADSTSVNREMHNYLRNEFIQSGN